MRFAHASWKSLGLVLLLAVGCAPGLDPAEEKASPPPEPAPNVAQYLFPEEPVGARGILDLRRENQVPPEVVIVVGRVGGSKDPFVPDRAAFTIVDTALKPCNEGSSMDCPWPWDYCCEPKEKLTRGTLLVKFVDANGKTLTNRDNWLGQLGVQPLNTVFVHGQPQFSKDGQVTAIVARKIFVRPAVKPAIQKADKP